MYFFLRLKSFRKPFPSSRQSSLRKPISSLLLSDQIESQSGLDVLTKAGATSETRNTMDSSNGAVTMRCCKTRISGT